MIRVSVHVLVVFLLALLFLFCEVLFLPSTPHPLQPCGRAGCACQAMGRVLALTRQAPITMTLAIDLPAQKLFSHPG